MDDAQTMTDPDTGIVLVPSFHGEDCPGSGDRFPLDCCCDECDYFLCRFPDWDRQ